MMASTVALLLFNISEQEAFKIIVRVYIDLNFSRFCRDNLDDLSQLSREAMLIVIERNGLEYQHFFDDFEIFTASQMLGFKLCVTLFADYVGLKEVNSYSSVCLLFVSFFATWIQSAGCWTGGIY